MKHKGVLTAAGILLIVWWSTKAPRQRIPTPNEGDEAMWLARFGTSTKRSVMTYVDETQRQIAGFNASLIYGPDMNP